MSPRDRTAHPPLGRHRRAPALRRLLEPTPASESDAAPLVLVHGLGGSHAHWTVLGPLLRAATGRRILALDLPAHGYTPVAGRATTLEGLRATLHRFITDVAGGSCVLVGQSLGGLLTALQAATDPDVVRGLALIDPAMPPGVPPRMHPKVLATFAAYATPGAAQAVVRGRYQRENPEESVRASLGRICRHPDRVPPEAFDAAVEVMRRLGDGDIPAAPRRPGRLDVIAQAGRGLTDDEAAYLVAARSLIRLLLSPRAYPALLDASGAPTLLLHGERDTFVPVRVAAAAARAHGWELHVAADTGHAPHLEAAGWVAAHLARWLGQEPVSHR